MKTCVVKVRGPYRHGPTAVYYNLDGREVPVCSRCWDRIADLSVAERRAALGAKD